MKKTARGSGISCAGRHPYRRSTDIGSGRMRLWLNAQRMIDFLTRGEGRQYDAFLRAQRHGSAGGLGQGR
jgi:hypothetical protein